MLISVIPSERTHSFYWIYDHRAVDSMSSSVSVNRSCATYVQHFFKKSVFVSSVLFTVATSCKLQTVKLAHREESFYPILFEEIRTKKMLVFWKEIKMLSRIFVRVVWEVRTQYHSLVRKEAFVFWRYWINPRSCRDHGDSYCSYLWP